MTATKKKGDARDAAGVREARLQKVKALREEGVNPYRNDFRVSASNEEILSKYGELSGEELNHNPGREAAAGRLIFRRDFGKASFLKLLDRTGQLQVYLSRDVLGAEGLAFAKRAFDVGDFIGARGEIFRTRTGELTVRADEVMLLAKSLRPLPEKFHGITDTELRYRQRYLDLIANERSKEVFVARSRIIQSIRRFFYEREYLEVETPILQPVAGGAAARPFITHHNTLDMDLYLRIAYELYHKRLVVGGMERVFEINHCFRNEGLSTQHNPEFCMMEWYEAYATFEDQMRLTEDLISGLAQEVCGGTVVPHHPDPAGEPDLVWEIDLTPPFRRLPMVDSLVEVAGVPREITEDRERARRYAEERGLEIEEHAGLGTIISELFEELVEGKLIQPTFIIDYPTEISPLSRRYDDRPEFTERFELFILGREMANGFSELNDPMDQRERFLEQLALRERGDEEAHSMDEDFLMALEHGMPPAAGEGMGIDRLVMLLTDQPSIRDVILFPQMRAKE